MACYNKHPGLSRLLAVSAGFRGFGIAPLEQTTDWQRYTFATSASGALVMPAPNATARPEIQCLGDRAESVTSGAVVKHQPANDPVPLSHQMTHDDSAFAGTRACAFANATDKTFASAADKETSPCCYSHRASHATSPAITGDLVPPDGRECGTSPALGSMRDDSGFDCG